MHYVISDIHGCYEQYRKMLDLIRFGDKDTMYVLGDMVDRGPEGIKVLRDVYARPNMVALMGNHELIAELCLDWICQNTNQDEETARKWQAVIMAWMEDGGKSTLTEFLRLTPEEQDEVMDIFQELKSYICLEVGGRSFVLVHAGLAHFRPDKELYEYTMEELVFKRTDIRKTYFPDQYLVFGHTPTSLLFQEDLAYGGKAGKTGSVRHEIFEKGKLIGIDCGCVFGGKLGCLCLETMEKFYV